MDEKMNTQKWHKLLFILLLGFISGFTLSLSGFTLNFWLASNNIDKSTLGLFSIVSLPYAINFIWAPFFDGIILTKIGKIVAISTIHLCLIMSLISISLVDVNNQLLLIATLSLFVALFSSTQDIILGGIRSEILKAHEHGPAGGVYNLGYRIGMIISGSCAIYLSTFISWSSIYRIGALIVAIFSVTLCCFIALYQKNHTPAKEDIEAKFSLLSILSLFKHLKSTKAIIIILVFLILYRLADNLISPMMNSFLLQLGYDAFDIATTGKLWGTIGTIIGSFIATIVMSKITISKSLMYFGIIHALGHICLIIQYMVGKNYLVLFSTIAIESISCGMTMSAYMALITSLCSGKYRSTQYSILTSMMGISRSTIPAMSGVIVDIFGWQVFFITTIVLTVPSLMLIPYLTKLPDKKFNEGI
jgi:PAT family beta-lactamase induction signal transducer AmpG